MSAETSPRRLTRDGLQVMRDRGELRPQADPAALATFAALQGGLLLTQVRRDVRPPQTALDAMLDHIASLSRRPKK